MYATVRKIKVKPGKAAEVGGLIESEYIPLIAELPGFRSYTLVDLGDDEVSSLGLFQDADSADAANDKAQAWTRERLGPLVETPLEARAGGVLVDVKKTG